MSCSEPSLLAPHGPTAKIHPSWDTHRVDNVVPPLEGYNLFSTDPVLQEAVRREGAGWDEPALLDLGEELGRAEVLALGVLANQHPPTLRPYDRQGRRVDEVEFHPSWHQLMAAGVAAQVHALPWNHPRPGSHVSRAARHLMLTQVEAGVGCPLTMTFAAAPALAAEPALAQEWLPRITSTRYDPRLLPADQKGGCLVGMAMTEKQGGSDVRANTTRARQDGEGYRLTGHKWFCSAPMSDAFLTLAYTEEGMTCFLVPQWTPEGRRNTFYVQRLKDKLGNRSNASSEIEYRDTWARRVGPEGRGVRTILEMVSHTRLDCMIGSAALMRQALVQAFHHSRHRAAFGRRLAEQPLMQQVLADLALESEAATTLTLRLARAYDEARGAAEARPLVRLVTALGKYWICKRAPGAVYEALECLGGAGYVEEGPMPRLYREAPLSSIWEGSGNVIALDVLRALHKEPGALPALQAELALARGGHPDYDALLARLEGRLHSPGEPERGARRLVEGLALALQACLLIRHAPAPVADAFCAARLGPERGHEVGALPGGVDAAAVLERVWAGS